jgi:hypothetical protein
VATMERKDHIEVVHFAGDEPAMNMPYAPAIKVRSGAPVFIAGVTAAPGWVGGAPWSS